MNTHELPMILFTVLSQMSVGAFVVLGVIHLVTAAKYPGKVRDRLADPALLAIGPTLVIGFAVSTLHMNDIGNMLNVFRHVGSSWLSREIVFGMAFGGLGLLYFVAQWRHWFSDGVRHALAGLTAVAGLTLVWAQAMIYYSLPTVPGWNHWFTPVSFYVTTFMLGGLAVGVAMAVSLARHRTTAARDTDERLRPARTEGEVQEVGGGRVGSSLATVTRQTTLSAPEEVQAQTLVRSALRTIALTTAIAAMVVLVSAPLYILHLAADGSAAAAYTASLYTGAFFIMRMVLLVIGAVVLALLIYRATAKESTTVSMMALLITTSLGITFVAEIMGRSLFYDSLMRIGM